MFSAPSPHGHANADFISSLADGVGDWSIDSNRCRPYRKQGENTYRRRRKFLSESVRPCRRGATRPLLVDSLVVWGAIDSAKESLAPLVGGGMAENSPLFAGLEPRPNGGRAMKPNPRILLRLMAFPGAGIGKNSSSLRHKFPVVASGV